MNRWPELDKFGLGAPLAAALNAAPRMRQTFRPPFGRADMGGILQPIPVLGPGPMNQQKSGPALVGQLAQRLPFRSRVARGDTGVSGGDGIQGNETWYRSHRLLQSSIRVLLADEPAIALDSLCFAQRPEVLHPGDALHAATISELNQQLSNPKSAICAAGIVDNWNFLGVLVSTQAGSVGRGEPHSLIAQFCYRGVVRIRNVFADCEIPTINGTHLWIVLRMVNRSTGKPCDWEEKIDDDIHTMRLVPWASVSNADPPMCVWSGNEWIGAFWYVGFVRDCGQTLREDGQARQQIAARNAIASTDLLPGVSPLKSFHQLPFIFIAVLS